MKALETHAVTKVYGQGTQAVTAVDAVTMAVERGEFIALVGPSGSGKTTLLAMLAGLLKPSDGKIVIAGYDLTKMNDGQRTRFRRDYVGFTFQANNLVPYLTVRENVRLTAGLHGMSKAEVARRFDDIIAFAEIENFVDTPYKHLSSGMKVRLAFAVVSQLDEPTLLVDEVLAVGDKAFREKCYRRIDQLLAEGRTLFFVSHNEKDLRRFCTRGLYLDKGALQLDAPISEVLAAYNSDYNS